MKTYSQLVGRGEKQLSKKERKTARDVRSKYNVSKNNDQLLPKPKTPLDAKPKPKAQPKEAPKAKPLTGDLAVKARGLMNLGKKDLGRTPKMVKISDEFLSTFDVFMEKLSASDIKQMGGNLPTKRPAATGFAGKPTSPAAANKATEIVKQKEAAKGPALNPDVAEARRRRKQLEDIKSRETKGSSASPEVTKARAARKQREVKKEVESQAKRAPSIAPKKQSKVVPTPDKTPVSKPANKVKPPKPSEADKEEAKYQKKLAAAKSSGGFGSGLKSSLGGDVFMNTKDKKTGKVDPRKLEARKAAQRAAGKKFGNFVKSVPGKVVGSVLGSDTSPEVKTAQSGDLKGAKRGIYNPK